MNIKRFFTGPSWEEMGLPADYGKNTAAVNINPPIPYKAGTEHAQWPVTAKSPTLWNRISARFKRSR